MVCGNFPLTQFMLRKKRPEYSHTDISLMISNAELIESIALQNCAAKINAFDMP